MACIYNQVYVDTCYRGLAGQNFERKACTRGGPSVDWTGSFSDLFLDDCERGDDV